MIKAINTLKGSLKNWKPILFYFRPGTWRATLVTSNGDWGPTQLSATDKAWFFLLYMFWVITWTSNAAKKRQIGQTQWNMAVWICEREKWLPSGKGQMTSLTFVCPSCSASTHLWAKVGTLDHLQAKKRETGVLKFQATMSQKNSSPMLTFPSLVLCVLGYQGLVWT